MDIQYVLDPYACAMYMLSYITKAEREMGDLLRNAQREARDEGNEDAISQLRKLGTVYLQNREISVMGAIYLICSMPLKNSSRKVMFLQTDVNGQKISLPLSDLQANAGKSEQVWKTTQIEKYINRPSTPKYNSMCMATFFSNHYQVSSKSDNINTNVDEENDDDIDEETDDDTEDETNLESDIKGEKLNKANGHLNVSTSKQPKSRQKTQPPIQLQNCSIKMKERTKGKPAVIRYPRVSVAKDSERYHMNMLRLYLPHRRKHIKPARYEKYEDYHLNGYITINGERARIKDIVKENMVDFEPKTDDIDQAWEALRNCADQQMEDAWAAINPEGEQQRLDDELERADIFDDESDNDYAEINIPELQSKNTSREDGLVRCAIESCNPDITPEQAELMMRQLNNSQRQIFNHVAKWCDNKAQAISVPPFHIFLTGGAGTGKSHVINCIKYYAQKAFAPFTDSADDTTVLLLAHTGTAAFNISGQTICSALKIGTSLKDYRPLAEESLNTLRTKYHHVQLVIIDEISMVSANQLSYIHGRLQQIKGTSASSYFGNVSILAVGDFYQLPPVTPPTPLCYPHKEILKDLWNHLFEIFELTEIMRQKDDAVFAEMLNRLRVRKQDEPLEKADEKLLESRVVNDNLRAPDDALHLFYMNDHVDKHNDRKLKSLPTPEHKLTAIDIDQIGGRIIKKHETPHDTSRRKDNTALVPYLKLAVGARAMLIANIDVADGLSNGVCGTVEGIEFSNSENMPAVVYVKFDSDRIGAQARASNCIPPNYAGCVPIKPRKETFQLQGKKFSTTREQMPLKLAWAVTIHKVQGQTTDKAVISMKGLKKAMAYVALSRVTHLEGMYLMNYNQSKIFCHERVEENIAKMPRCDVSKANPMLDVDHNKHFIIAHHNIQSLRRHIEDLKQNTEIRKAHVICLSETWLTENSNFDSLSIEGYSLELVNSGNGRGVAMYIQNSVKYTVVPLLSAECDVLAIRTHGKANLLLAIVYKPNATGRKIFSTEMNNITAQIEVLDVDYSLFTGDFNSNLFKEDILPAFKQYHQVITEPTTTKGTLLDHIYVKPKPQEFKASVLTTYYSYHSPVFISIRC